MSSRIVLAPKLAGATELRDVDFASQIGNGETISTKVVTAATYSGTDASPASIISGAATSSGSIVTQSLTGGVAGVQYLLTWTVTTSLSQTILITSFLTVL